MDLSADMTWHSWAGGVLALGAALLLTPLVIQLAHRRGWLAHPKVDRWHERPTALMGGIAIYAAATTAVIAAALVAGSFPWALWGGATLLFAVGLVDDLRGVRPITKLIAQVAAAALLLYAGHAFGKGSPYWLSVPLTFLWVIGITNAINLLDNMDGLAAGIAAITAAVLALFSGIAGGGGPAVAATIVAATAVAGAAMGFLWFNFKPARIFMGDCGSLFLGYVIAAFAVVVQGQISGRSGLGIYLVSVAVLAVPIFDTTLVTVARTLSGRAVSQGGRDHSSHRLVVLGLSERGAVLTLYGISLTFGVLALAFHVAEVTLFYALIVFPVVALAVFGLHLGSVNVYKKSGARKSGAQAEEARELPVLFKLAHVLRALLGRSWKAVLGMVGDLLLVAAAFVLAHYMRFENGLAPARSRFLMEALGGVVAIKLLVFWGAGLYRGLWRHAGTPEVVLVARTSALASVAAYGVLAAFYGVSFLSEAAFLIDWMIVTLAIAGVRFGFRGLRQYLLTKRTEGRRALLYGAGDAGLLALRELRQNPRLEVNPIGFVDDDAGKRALRVQGVTVLGALDDLPVLCQKHAIETVIFTAPSMSDAHRARAAELCRCVGVRCQLFEVSLRGFSEAGDGLLAPAATSVPALQN